MAEAQVIDPEKINQQGLKDAAEAGDIEALYNLISLDPHLLEKIDKIPFADTPLHVAVSAGQTHFAMEMMRLKPSFARKPNHHGFSPIHLVLNLHPLNRLLAYRLVEVDPDLVRVKGRMGITPLHYVAEIGELDLLTKFLVVCPKSIEDLTIRSETALHVAMKNERYEAVEVLVGWLRRSLHEGSKELRKKVLNWKDDEGNTVLHIATSSDRPEVVICLLNNGVDVNSKNFRGRTALDITVMERLSNKEKLKKMLLDFNASIASSLPGVARADYLRSRISYFESFLIFIMRRKINITSETRNALMVVAVLMVTATYQTIINPPGGFWKDNYTPPDYLNTTQINITKQINTPATMAFDTSNPPPHSVGTTVLNPAMFFIFTVYTSTVLWTSIAIILILLPRDKLAYVLLVPLSVFLVFGHIFSMVVISGIEPLLLISRYSKFILFCLVCITGLIIHGIVSARELMDLLVHRTLSQ